MEKEEGILVRTKELRRLKVIEQVIEKKIKQKQAGVLLRLSARQVRRLTKRVKQEGLKGLIHQLRGKPSNQRHPESFKMRVLNLCRKKYEGFGPTLAQEKLEELDKVKINRETLRQWMMVNGLWELARKGQKHLEWRERKASFGEMIQVDGSHHDWLEGRGHKLVLMGYIDDAASEVFARFYDYEGTMPAMDSFNCYSKKYGLPHAIYIDRLSAYQGSGKLSLEDELAGLERKLSRFERALEALGVEVIHAQSAQAKGRVERLFRTFQDRLIKEMRLAGIKTKEEANRFLAVYLPKYNRRFSVKPRDETNLHRPRPSDKEMKHILSIQTKHVLRNDNTIRHENRFYQITEKLQSAIKEVTVEEHLDGKLYIVNGERELKYREIKLPPKRYSQVKTTLKKPFKPTQPALNHFLKKESFERRLRLQNMKRAKWASQSASISHLNAFKQTISTQGNLQHHPDLTYHQFEQLQQKEESNKEEKELLLAHS